MFLDEKGRLFSKVSIVDIAVAIFLICAVLFVGLKFFAPPGNVNSAEETAYEYTLSVCLMAPRIITLATVMITDHRQDLRDQKDPLVHSQEGHQGCRRN